MKKKSIYQVISVLFVLLTSLSSFAQETKKWRYLLEPYVVFPNMKGTLGLGNLPEFDIDEDPGDIFNHLHFGGMLYAEARSDQWAISSDFIYMDLRTDVSSDNNVASGGAEAQQLAWEFAGLYRLKPWLDAGIALQLNSIKANADLFINTPGGPLESQNEITETWLEPSIVGRVMIPNNKWLFQARANIGGFGIGSDFYWQLQAYAGYRLSKLVTTSIGYRYISADYDKGSGSDRFLYDVDTFGAVLRLGFNF